MLAAMSGLMLVCTPAVATTPAADPLVLRVCADPNNLPFSNRAEAGFENRIARILADALGARLEYVWWVQRRGFIRQTLGAGRCDVIVAVPSDYEHVASTRAYYRSSYMFVQRPDSAAPITSLDDPLLAQLKIGVHLGDGDASGTPPALALAARNLNGKLTGFALHGDNGRPDPTIHILHALQAGEIDIAIVWGPLAAPYLRQKTLVATPVLPQMDQGFLPMHFEIAVGVQKNALPLRARLDGALVARGAEIRQVLRDAGVPLVDGMPDDGS